MRKWGKVNIPETYASHETEADSESEDLKDVLRKFRDTHCAAAEKPEFYWKVQRGSILAKLDAPAHAPVSKLRFAYLAVPVAAVVFLCLLFFAENSKALIPDLAAGYDQDLLIEMERALSRRYPLALKPAALLAGEIEQEAVR